MVNHSTRSATSIDTGGSSLDLDVLDSLSQLLDAELHILRFLSGPEVRSLDPESDTSVGQGVAGLFCKVGYTGFGAASVGFDYIGLDAVVWDLDQSLDCVQSQLGDTLYNHHIS